VDRATLWRRLAGLGFKGKFLATLQALYEGDHVKCVVNGVTTEDVYLGRGLRQGCSLSPILFALYIAAMGEELASLTLGVTLYRICISALFFAVSQGWCNFIRVC
jgi:hypothetical protein